MTSTVPNRATRSGSRRLGYGIGAAINLAMLYAVNVWPGWEVLPFLTEETPLVLGLVNLSLVAGVIINLVNLVLDLAPVKTLGDLILLGIGLAVLVRVWQVFPFDFADSGFDWALLVRAILVVAFVGSIIGVIAQLVILIRSLSGRTSDERP